MTSFSMTTARITLSEERSIAPVDPRLFGALLEHAGRGVYGGVYEPGHPLAGEEGFRADVLDLVKTLGLSVVRYPGGDFVSAYRWEDGIGFKNDRPVRLDLARRTTETNQFGLNDFLAWCSQAGVAPLIAVNLGTRDFQSARDLIEYCNHPSGTYWSELRAYQGSREPYAIKLWGLGNRMDDPEQIGQKSAEGYGQVARETAKIMKRVDPTIEVIACGSSGRSAQSAGAWDATVLDLAYEQIDYLSLYAEYPEVDQDPLHNLARSLEMDRAIRAAALTCDATRARKQGRKIVNLACDSWAVRRLSEPEPPHPAPWAIAPPLHEDVFTLEDALVAGCALITLLRHADRVKIACHSQLANVHAPIRTTDLGGAWRQATFYPLFHASRFGRGVALDPDVVSPAYDDPEFGPVPLLEAVAVHDPEADGLTLFAVNRSLTESLPLEGDVRSFPNLRVLEHLTLAGPDLNAANTLEKPAAVVPHPNGNARIEEGKLLAVLSPASWNVVRMGQDVNGLMS